MSAQNIFFAHSGGVTTVLNSIAHQVIQSSKAHPKIFNKVLAGKNGIIGAIEEELIDTSLWSNDTLSALQFNPASAFGSCRHKLKTNSDDIDKIFATFKAHNIGYFIYNGGNDSQDTTLKIWQKSQQINYPLVCIGIPKTIDNDLPNTDTCPGYGSAAKYIATSVLEASLDVQSMCYNSTKVFILEVMGRNAGWLAAASALAQKQAGDPPHIILLPEVDFNQKAFLRKVTQTVKTKGFCVIVTSEGIQHNNKALASSNLQDAFGHNQLGGIAPYLAQLIQQQCQLKTHWSVADYLQRSAGHLTSLCDLKQSKALGNAAIEKALQGKTGIMLTIERTNHNPYQWQIQHSQLDQIANKERFLPEEFITKDGWQITEEAKSYLRPLIEGEAYPPFQQGIPNYKKIPQPLVQKLICPIANPS